MLELIRFRYPHLIPLLFSDKSLFSNDGGILCPNKEFHSKIETLIEEKSDLYRVKKVIESLFPDDFENVHPLSIQYPKNFHSYFALKLKEGQISQEKFNDSKTKTIDEFISQIDKWVNEGYKIDLRSKFVVAKYESVEEYKKMIMAHFHLLNKHFSADNVPEPDSKLSLKNIKTNVVREEEQYPDFTNLLKKLFPDTRKKFLTDDEFIIFLKDLLVENDYVFFKCIDFFERVVYNHTEVKECISIMQIISSLLTEYMEQPNVNFNRVWNLSRFIINIKSLEEPVHTNSAIIAYDAKDKLEKFLTEENIEAFFKLEIENGDSELDKQKIYKELYNFVVNTQLKSKLPEPLLDKIKAKIR